MKDYKFQDYLDLGINPIEDSEGLHFSKANIDFIIDKFLKLKKQFDEYKRQQEAIDDITCSQFDFACAEAEYYQYEVRELKEQLKSIRLLNRQYDRFQIINAGLKSECKRYKQEQTQLKQQIAELKAENERLKEDKFVEDLHSYLQELKDIKL